MRRTFAEWLLLPLFLMPVAVGTAVCVLARDRHAREVAELRAEGSRLVAEWAEEGGLVRKYLETCSTLGVTADVRVLHPRGEARLQLTLFEPRTRPVEWRLADEIPAGLSPEAVADPGVRLQVETGVAPARIEGVDPAAREFGALAARPDPSRLREVPLPASTKLFLVRRWLASDADSNELRGAERVLVALRDYQRLVAQEGDPLPPGMHRSGAVTIVSTGGLRPDRIHLGDPPAVTVSLDLADPPVSVIYGRPAPAAVWRGRLGAPIAGDWAVVHRHGDRWWTDPRFLGRAGPTGAVLLAFLAIPLALLVSIRRRRRLDEARARFVNELAHDLRTPLTSLRLFAEMLAAGKVEEEDRGRYVEVMARESARVSSLLANLLDLSRLDRRKRSFAAEWIDLDEAAETALREFTAIHPDRADDVRVEGADGIRVRADRTALSRSLANLLDNAGKFTAPGTAIRISWETADAHTVRVVVADEGPGIPRSEQRRAFARYARGSRSAKDGIPGSGLGLALVRELAEGMGGAAFFARGEKGTAVVIRLPGGVDG